MADLSWVEIMNWFSASPRRPLVLIVLARNNDEPLDELNLAGRAGLINQQMTGEIVETAVMMREISDLSTHGYIERSSDGFRWQLTKLGVLVSRQWVTDNLEPLDQGPLDEDAVRDWRNRVLAFMDHDVELAKAVGISEHEWFATQSQRLAEMHVLNRVLGEMKLPNWLMEIRAESDKQRVEEE